jgi:hypothetical protein
VQHQNDKDKLTGPYTIDGTLSIGHFNVQKVPQHGAESKRLKKADAQSADPIARSDEYRDLRVYYKQPANNSHILS